MATPLPAPVTPLSPDPWDVVNAPQHLPIGVVALQTLPTGAAVVAVGAPETVNVDVTPGPRISAISGAIEVLAVTGDGRAAVTADTNRSVRLWPTLDGRREPFVLSMRAPAMLAITRDGEMFAIGGVDAAGQLEIVRSTPSGDRVQRIDVAMERPLVWIRATSFGFVALRDDRVIALVDLRGTVRTTLTTEPGEYVASIALRGDRALAIIEQDNRVSGRWIDFAIATWGERTPPLPIHGDRVALSPTYERIAALRPNKKALSIVALDTGKVVRTRKDGFDDENGAEQNIQVVGFLNDRDVVITNGRQSWWNREGDGDGPAGGVFEVANGRLFGVFESSISLTTPSPDANPLTEFVGYRMSFVSQLHAKRTGFLATDGQSLVELDSRFRTRIGFALQDLPEAIGRILLVGDRHAIGFSYQNHRSLYLISTDLGAATLVASNVIDFAYERSTRLLYYAVPDHVYLARFDADAGAFGAAVEIQAKAGEIHLLDAAEAKGDEVAILVQVTPKLLYQATFGTLGKDAFVTTSKRDIDPEPEWWEENGNPGTLVRSPRVRATSPDRSLTAELRDHRLVLHAGKTERWTVPIPGAAALAWTPRGELVVYSSGIASVDLETGALRGRQCGSWFGRWETPPSVVPFSQLCEVP